MSRTRLIVTLAALLLVLLPAAVATADPGTPGQDTSAAGVYNGGDPLGEDEPDENTGEDEGEDDGQPLGDPETDRDDTESVPFSVPGDDEKDDNNVVSLPFTGWSAAIVIATALLLFAVGLALNRAGRLTRGRRA